jgi:hypothetical protein
MQDAHPRERPIDLRPKLADLAPAVYWLRQHDVPVARLAAVFGTDSGHIRQLTFRGNSSAFRFYSVSDSLDLLLARPTQSIRSRLAIRPHEDFVLLSLKQKQRIDFLNDEIGTIVADASVTFLERVARVRKLLPLIGYAAGVDRIRLLAFVRQRLGWLFVHSGYCSSAFSEAQAAINLAHIAYNERGQPEDLRTLTDSCLIASNACLLACDPATALRFLDLARQASERIGDSRGSEHYRQYGVALFQMGRDEQAKEAFHSAVTAMDAKAEAENIAHILMTGSRHVGLLGEPSFDRELEMLDQVEKDYSKSSLQHSMALNWTAACGLGIDSAAVKLTASEMARYSVAISGPFGHQATTAKLLALTPELGLDPRVSRDWIRHALYSNAFRQR